MIGAKFHRIEASDRRERDVDRQHLAAEMERVPIRRRLRGGLRADIAAGAGPVLHEHRLAPHVAQFLRDDATERVDGAAGGKRNDDADGAVGVVLRAGVDARRQDRDRSDEQRKARAPHGRLPIGPCVRDQALAFATERTSFPLECGTSVRKTRPTERPAGPRCDAGLHVMRDDAMKCGRRDHSGK